MHKESRRFVTGMAFGGVLECVEDDDCIASEASCISNLCECPVGSVFSTDYSTCLECT